MSIVHLVCWKYKAETEGAVRDEHVARLLALPNIISDIIEFEVGTDIMHLDRSFDTGLFSRFQDLAALNAYSDHPEHQKVAAMGSQIAEKSRFSGLRIGKLTAEARRTLYPKQTSKIRTYKNGFRRE